MLKRGAVLALLAPLTVGNLSRPVEAAGWGPLAALMLAGHLSGPPDMGWRRGGGFRRAPYYPRYYYGYRDGGFHGAPYYPRYSGGYYGSYSGGYYGGYDEWCGGYGNYGGYGGYRGYGNYSGYDGYGW